MRIPDSNVFFFDSKFRPCPLKQDFIGVSEKKAIKRIQVMNEVTYEKVIEQVIDQNSQELLPYGFAVHHAGMKREDPLPFPL